MAVYSQRFFLGNATSPGVNITVPAGVTWVVRDVSATMAEGSTSNVLVFINGTLIIELINPTGTHSATVRWVGRQVLNAGDVLAVSGSAGAVPCSISGYQLV